MLNIFGRAIRCPTPPGSRLTSTARALRQPPPHLVSHHGSGEEEPAYTMEEERELEEYLDRDLPLHIGSSHQQPPQPSTSNRGEQTSRKYRHQRQIRSEEWAPATPKENPERSPSVEPHASGSNDRDPQRKSQAQEQITVPPSQSTPQMAQYTLISTSSPPKPMKSKRKRRSRKQDADPFAPFMPPRSTYVVTGHLAEFPYVGLTLICDPVGLPPGANSILFRMGFRYQNQILFRKRSNDLTERLRRVRSLLHVQYLTETKMLEMKGRKYEGLQREKEAREVTAELALQHVFTEDLELQHRASTGRPPPDLDLDAMMSLLEDWEIDDE